MTVPLSAKQLVDRLWNYCNVLRDDGVSTIEYVEQLTSCCSSRWPTSGPSRGSTRSGSSPRPGLAGLLEPRRRAGDALHRRSSTSWQAARHARHDLPEGAEPHPGPGQAAQADRRPDRRGELVGHRDRHQGRRLRGAAAKGAEDTSRAPASTSPRASSSGRSSTACGPSRRHGRRPGMRHRRLPARRPRVHPDHHAESLTPRSATHLRDDASRLRARRRHRPAGRDEPAAARHRDADGDS